ncbi:oligosaccharide deacetylase [Devosia nitrariae]|uniref:Chitooligosaccharide deacetylase n=2 Tax=Devosia nitrariae TaxID=2071872 RepID=A0ABQ5WCD1_9HYPH|nr:oligosaccharide deacetylase [Devosia nitrariae]
MVLGVVAAGCAKAPDQRGLDLTASAPPLQAYQPVDTLATASIGNRAVSVTNQPLPPRIFTKGNLAGRTLTVGSADEITLLPGEVILTFDDGPRPGKTEAILDTLDAFGVGATFMMLGRAAERHPDLAQLVAARGHAIGTHTYDHANLADMSNAEATAEIAAGEAAVAEALGHPPSPFFRFPYLAQTGFLRTSLVQSDIVVLDVDIDSKDYYGDTPAKVMERTLARIEARGRGIVLFHDIHARTVVMLPEFLGELERRGYQVVRLAAKPRGIFGREVITAQSPVPASSFLRLN